MTQAFRHWHDLNSSWFVDAAIVTLPRKDILVVSDVRNMFSSAVTMALFLSLSLINIFQLGHTYQNLDVDIGPRQQKST